MTGLYHIPPGQREGFRDWILAILRAVGGNTFGMPLYLIFSSDLPLEMQGDGCGGLFSTDLDLAMREYIGNRWEGRGVAVLVCDHSGVWIQNGPYGVELARAALCRRALAVAIHELCHAIDPRALRASRRQATVDQIFAPDHMVSDQSSIVQTLTIPNFSDVPQRHHGWNFYRRASHLAYRALRLRDIYPDEIVDHDFYHTSPLADFIEALGDECERLAGESLEKIEGMPLPNAFRELWRRDVERWLALTTADMHTWTTDRRRAFAAALAAADEDFFIENHAAVLAA